ncbi:MAG: type II secretion system major pseudopilin GspG [Hyphomicrobium sp.]|uniref:type II secretion system major pseudopilin GspG n=1 Tax=Hyphomicrobium sp. TaxID=82 RepID=UPI003D129070
MLFRVPLSKRRALQKRPSDREPADAGYTLLEVLVVVGIVVLLASIAAPQVLGYLGRARTETAKVQIGSIVTALELYALDMGGYPPSQAGLSALMAPPGGSAQWRGPYLKRADGLVDPWGRPYQYRFGGGARQPQVFTLGRDNAPGGAEEDRDVVN